MANDVTQRINSNLASLFNIEDPIYKSLICDPDGTSAFSVYGTGTYGSAVYSTQKPISRNIGAIASQIEYLRQAGIYFLQQIYINEANQEFLKYILNNYFDSYRLDGETDSEWINRTYAKVFQQKVSRASIIYSLTPYSSQTPEVSTVFNESGYADFSFADVYVSDEVTFEGETVYILPAIAESDESIFFTIRIKKRTEFSALESQI